MVPAKKWYLATIEHGEVRYEVYWGRPEAGIDTPFRSPWAILNDDFIIVDSGNGWVVMPPKDRTTPREMFPRPRSPRRRSATSPSRRRKR